MEVCRLCLDLVQEDMFLRIGDLYKCIINNVVPEVDLEITSDPVICNQCSSSVDELHKFKILCFETQQHLKQKSKGLPDSEMTLKEILHGLIINEVVTEKTKERICRTCLEYIECESFTILRPTNPDAYLDSMLTMCLPEMDLQISRDPVMCEKCLGFLQKLHHLKSTCLDVEEKLKSYNQSQSTDLKSPINLRSISESLQDKKDKPEFINITYIKCEKIVDYANDEEIEKQNIFHEVQPIVIKEEEVDIKLEEFLNTPTKGILQLKRTKTSQKKVQNMLNDLHCNICGKFFSTIWSVQRHILGHKGVKRFECYVCHVRYSQKSILEKHIRSQHTGEKPFKCDLCPKAFTARSNLTSHYKTHQGIRPYICAVCGHSFSQKSNLKKHIKGHSGEKQFQCEVCQKMFASKYNLQSHMEIHIGEKPYSCDLCPESFRHIMPLKVHRLTHFGKCPYTCGICGMQFIHHSGLTSHEKTHSGDKPFECPICGKRFVKESIVTSHITLHTGEKQFECFMCKRKYADKSKLNYHLKKKCLKGISLSIKVR